MFGNTVAPQYCATRRSIISWRDWLESNTIDLFSHYHSGEKCRVTQLLTPPHCSTFHRSRRFRSGQRCQIATSDYGQGLYSTNWCSLKTRPMNWLYMVGKTAQKTCTRKENKHVSTMLYNADLIVCVRYECCVNCRLLIPVQLVLHNVSSGRTLMQR